jgi:hypothetical protein
VLEHAFYPGQANRFNVDEDGWRAVVRDRHHGCDGSGPRWGLCARPSACKPVQDRARYPGHRAATASLVCPTQFTGLCPGPNAHPYPRRYDGYIPTDKEAPYPHRPQQPIFRSIETRSPRFLLCFTPVGAPAWVVAQSARVDPGALSPLACTTTGIQKVLRECCLRCKQRVRRVCDAWWRGGANSGSRTRSAERAAVAEPRRQIPITKPSFDASEVEAARRSILSGWVTQGPEVAGAGGNRGRRERADPRDPVRALDRDAVRRRGDPGDCMAPLARGDRGGLGPRGRGAGGGVRGSRRAIRSEDPLRAFTGTSCFLT